MSNLTYYQIHHIEIFFSRVYWTLNLYEETPQEKGISDMPLKSFNRYQT